MDDQTRTAYSHLARQYSEQWLAQPEAVDIHKILKSHFKLGQATIDIGCGSGRDVDWLNKNGYPCEGFDSSAELLEIARDSFPSSDFKIAQLPKLSEIKKSYTNVFCETVIMHLVDSEISEALANLKRITAPGGIIYLSWRVVEGDGARSDDGRLYSAISVSEVSKEFLDYQILLSEEKMSASSGNKVHRLVLEKPSR